MLSHDQLAFAINKLYPELRHGKDFWVAHPVAAGAGEQIGDAEIMTWPEGVKRPDYKTLLKTFNAHADEFNARCAKVERLARLRESDWSQLLDIPITTREAWAQYRQALRDLPQQQGFPQTLVWPEPPPSDAF